MNDLVIERVREAIAGADRIVALTGAGISAESGVPTFRGEEGLWRRYRAEELATPEAFARDPATVWAWYAYRRRLVAACRPNAAHHALARAGQRVAIVTQNVDGLHRRAAAGVPDVSVPELVELHGSLFGDRCTRCQWRVERDPAAVDDAPGIPRCERCGELARPAVVWFGESLDPERFERAAGLVAAADVCLVVGTSAIVHPAAGLATMAIRCGAMLVEVNPEATPLSGEALRCAGPAAAVLPLLLHTKA